MPRPKEPKYVEAEQGYVWQKISEIDQIESAQVFLEEVKRLLEGVDKEIHLKGKNMSIEKIYYSFGEYNAYKKVKDLPEEAREWLERQKKKD